MSRCPRLRVLQHTPRATAPSHGSARGCRPGDRGRRPVRGGLVCFGQRAAAHAEHLPGFGERPIGENSLELHPVRVPRQFDFGQPRKLHRGRRERFTDCNVGQVAAARGGQAAVQRDAVALARPGSGCGTARLRDGGPWCGCSKGRGRYDTAREEMSCRGLRSLFRSLWVVLDVRSTSCGSVGLGLSRVMARVCDNNREYTPRNPASWFLAYEELPCSKGRPCPFNPTHNICSTCWPTAGRPGCPCTNTSSARRSWSRCSTSASPSWKAATGMT